MTILEQLKAREQELLSTLDQARRTAVFLEGALAECQEMQRRVVQDTAGSVGGKQRPLNPSKTRVKKA